MGRRRQLRKFTARCKSLFDAGVALAKDSGTQELLGRWRATVGPLVVVAREEKGGTASQPDCELSLTVKIAGKTLFSAQVFVRYSDKGPEHRSERVEKFVPGRWEEALATAFRLLTTKSGS